MDAFLQKNKQKHNVVLRGGEDSLFCHLLFNVIGQHDYLHNDSLANSDERTLVSEFATSAQKWSKIMGLPEPSYCA